jgi:ketosteroid isomerase-like protein
MAEQNDEVQVRTLMSEITRAFMSRDVQRLSEIFDDSFTLSEPSGMVVTRERWLADVASGDLVVQSVQSDEFDVRPVGDAMRVRGRLTIRAKYSRADYNGTFKYMGVYRKQDDGWKLSLSSARRVLTP